MNPKVGEGGGGGTVSVTGGVMTLPHPDVPRTSSTTNPRIRHVLIGTSVDGSIIPSL
jgi:hypothetical protein